MKILSFTVCAHEDSYEPSRLLCMLQIHLLCDTIILARAVPSTNISLALAGMVVPVVAILRHWSHVAPAVNKG